MKKILAIGLILVVLAIVFTCACLDDYYTSLDAADAKLTEAMGYFSASMDLADQGRFDAADARLDEAVTAISMAEANIDDAKAMGAPKEETDVYDATIPYVKSWIAIARNTNNDYKLMEEIDEKGESKDIYQRWITETDNALNNLDSAEKIGLDIMQKYPTIASELEVAQGLRDIKIIKADCQAMKKDLQYITGVQTTTMPDTPVRYTVTTPTPTQTPTPTPKAVFPVTYPISITVDAGTSWIIFALGDYNYLIMDFGDAMTGEEIYDEGGRWELTSMTKTTRTYNLYWSDGEYLDTVKIYSNGQAIISPGTDNIAATWD